MQYKQWWNSNFLFADSIAKATFLAGSVSADGASAKTNAGRFADSITYRNTVL